MKTMLKLLLFVAVSEIAASSPNILYILGDDQAWTD